MMPQPIIPIEVGFVGSTFRTSFSIALKISRGDLTSIVVDDHCDGRNTESSEAYACHACDSGKRLRRKPGAISVEIPRALSLCLLSEKNACIL